MNKPRLIATPTLVNFLQKSEHTFEMGVVHLTYDKHSIDLEVHLHEDNQLDVGLCISGDEITLTSNQKQDVYKYIHELYKDEIDAENEQTPQDLKDDLSYDVMKENRF